MKFRFTAIGLFLMLILSLSAQQQGLYMPIELRKAYEAGTRTANGTVSNLYHQNHAKYQLKATIDPVTRQIEGIGQIIYYNEFPIMLNEIFFHSYKDLYKDGMIIKSISLNDRNINIDDHTKLKKHTTNYEIILDKGLKQGDSVKLNISWSITIPEKVNRDGAFDASSMFVAYWYPEIAVYDDLFGWDQITFDGKAEFYHDFSDFNIELEIPSKFIIWASDAPINRAAIFPDKLLKRIQEAEKSEEPVNIISAEDLKKGLKMKSTQWKYQSNNFPDFSFALSDHYLWDGCKYADEMGTYFLNSAYPAYNPPFKDVILIEKSALDIFHHKFPKYPFPFKHFVAFNGETGGGMEFPGMCNDQAKSNYHSEGKSYSDWDANKLLTVHEMMHMYFPFLMGINEKRFAWMDEGMAEFAEDAFTDINLESTKSRERFASLNIAPMMVQTYTIPYTYVSTTYDISSQSYYALMEMLGKELFDQCMKTYLERWNYHHPSPYDFFFTFNDVASEDLNWFWKAWYFDWGYPDMGIKSFKNGILEIENIGGLPLGLNLEIILNNGHQQLISVNPRVWKDDNLHKVDLSAINNIQSINLKTLNGADAVIDNNSWPK